MSVPEKTRNKNPIRLRKCKCYLNRATITCAHVKNLKILRRKLASVTTILSHICRQQCNGESDKFILFILEFETQYTNA